MQTSLHIYSLVRELKDKLIGTIFIGTEFYKKERESFLHFKNKKGTLALGLIYHPVSHGCFLIPRGKVKVKTNEKPWPFFQPAHESIVKKIEQIGLDRIFRIDLEKEGELFTIIIEAIGPNGNFWLLDKQSLILATLRNRKYDSAIPYQPPPPLSKIDPFEIELYQLIEIIRASDQHVDNVIRRNMLGLDNFLIDELLLRAGISPDSSAMEVSDEEVKKFFDELKETLVLYKSYERGYFYATEKGNYAVPFKLRYLDEEVVKCKSLSMAVYEAIRTKRIERKEVDQTKQLLDAVKRHLKKIRRKVDKIADDLKSARDFEIYKKQAELLQINLNTIKKGADQIEVEDIYSSDSQMIVIKIDPALTPAENAARYFKKFRKGRDALKLLERRLENGQDELESAEKMASEFDLHFENALEKYEAEIENILPKSGDKKAPHVRLPYREAILSTGVTIFIGKDGADNDTTTFRHAKPYELWFHASQCPGSHVVMKFPSKKFEPSTIEIEETAAVAAYHSKARNSARVPVIYTQRKYVRKPRNAKPGLVHVEREKSVMVVPKKER